MQNKFFPSLDHARFCTALYLPVRIVGEILIVLACCWEAGLFLSPLTHREAIEAVPVAAVPVLVDAASSPIGLTLAIKMLVAVCTYIFAKAVSALLLQKLWRQE